MTEPEAVSLQEKIEGMLQPNETHYRTEKVRSPNLKFININISIKVTKE